jgi:hypothetical protein
MLAEVCRVVIATHALMCSAPMPQAKAVNLLQQEASVAADDGVSHQMYDAVGAPYVVLQTDQNGRRLAR